MSLSISGQLAPLKDIDPKHILDRYLGEETGPQIAKSLGVTRAALSMFMIKHAEEQWKDAQVVKAIARKEKAEEAMETADNIVDLTRARDLLKSAQWDLERVCRRIYGQDAPPAGTNAVQININLRGAAQQYDSKAPQHEVITQAVIVDNTD